MELHSQYNNNTDVGGIHSLITTTLMKETFTFYLGLVITIFGKHSHIGVPPIQLGKGSVECNREIASSVDLLEWVQAVWDDGVDVSHDQHFKDVHGYGAIVIYFTLI